MAQHASRAKSKRERGCEPPCSQPQTALCGRIGIRCDMKSSSGIRPVLCPLVTLTCIIAGTIPSARTSYCFTGSHHGHLSAHQAPADSTAQDNREHLLHQIYILSRARIMHRHIHPRQHRKIPNRVREIPHVPAPARFAETAGACAGMAQTPDTLITV